MQPLQARPHRAQGPAIGLRALALRVLLWLLLLLGSAPATAQGVELATLATERRDGALTLEFAARIVLPRAVEDALQQSVPVYFVAQAELRRNRWYWRDERVARVSRQWRLAFQPLTGNWRVGLAGINQTFNTLEEALAALSRSAGWRLVELAQLDADSSYYIDFSYRLDTSQLPGPMQFGLGGGSEWVVGVQRTLAID